ncbi:MAG: hypothetical protein GEV28_18245 [Actinophytocola sp.]|uniref:hypothetical protein n=1 Tax=Actinophytocola sp. TaxID=1872138 RepID=UPI0013257CB1|nr:hypothetical protein [Actinophytocola sp.]MPZ82227.1 hypothetical protein [Actinophytocola sp.]
MVATASGEVLASYTWPAGSTIDVSVFGSGGPLIAVGVLPHANEPLGSAFAATVPFVDTPGRIALVGPIDPPPPEHRFALPTDPVRYVAGGYLQPLPDQAEFAHCANPSAPAQHRAAELRARLKELGPDALLLLHNDIGAIGPYLYANRHWRGVSDHLRGDLADAFPRRPKLAAAWTTTLDDNTYAYFPAKRIGVAGTECAGLHIERELGIPTLTVELPMFHWDHADHTRRTVAEAVGRWIARGATHGGDTDRLVCEVIAAVGTRQVPMVPAEISARVVWAVLAGLHEDLSAGG